MKKNDRSIALLISMVTISIVILSFINYSFFNWIFERHRNAFSWYVQMVFILPFGFFAFKRSLTGMAVSILLFVTSTFWFPVPDQTDPLILSLLYLEADWIFGSWFMEKTIVTMIMFAIITGSAVALWQRSLDIGVITMFLVCIEKILWEYFFSEDKFSFSGILAAVITSAIGLLHVFFTLGKKGRIILKEGTKKVA